MMCVGVTLWFGWGGVVSGCRLQPATPPQPNHNVTPTHIEPELLRMDVLTSETC